DNPGLAFDIVAVVEGAIISEEASAGSARTNRVQWFSALEPNVPEFREWLRKRFFDYHLSMYSKSRRRAPIYWQLATPSASYSVWLYLNALSRDTIYKIQNDLLVLKLAQEQRRLDELRAEVGPNPKAGARKQLEAQTAFVEEL